MRVIFNKPFVVKIISIFLLLALDQYTKFLSIIKLKGTDGIDIIEGIFRLQYLENRGAAFGMMEGRLILFYILTPTVVIFIISILYQIPNNKRYMPLNFAGILIIAGALGNFIDRVRFKYVVDFLYFELIDFPIFNVADIYVCVATALFVILLLFYYKDEELDMISIFKK